MRKIKLALIGAVLALLINSPSIAEPPELPDPPSDPHMPRVPDGVLEIEAHDLDGHRVTLADERFKGKVVYVDLWGTWCPPCRREMPVLSKLQQRYRERGLEVIGIAFEGGKDEANIRKLRKYVQEYEPAYTILYGGRIGEAADRLKGIENFSFSSFPTGIFIGRDGRVKNVKIGFDEDWTPEFLETTFELLLAETP